MLHPPTDVADDVLHTIAARLGLPDAPWSMYASIGRANTIYRLGDAFVLKVPRQHASTIAGAALEAHAATIASAAGVRTPAVVLFDDTCTLLPVPFAVYDYVAGMPLQSLAADTVWRALGRDLARLHAVPRSASSSRILTNDSRYDAGPWVDDCLAAGTLLPDEAAWLRSRLDRLRGQVDIGGTTWFCHGDVNWSNVLVNSQGDIYHALLDWGSAMWFDAAYDFAIVSLAVVPWLLEGYRAEAPLPTGTTFAARIVWYHLTFAIWNTRRRSPQERAEIAAHMARLRRQAETFVDQTTGLSLG